MDDGEVPATRVAADRRHAALMSAAQAGDAAAYRTLLRECVGLIRTIARQRGTRPDRIDDVVQETLLSLHRALHTYDPERSFVAWLRAIAQRRAVDVARTVSRHGRREVHSPVAYENYPDPAAPDRAVERVQAGGALRGAIEGLPAGQREAVQRLVIEEHTLSEAAALTGRRTGALKVNLHRALKTLRARLGHGSGE